MTRTVGSVVGVLDAPLRARQYRRRSPEGFDQTLFVAIVPQGRRGVT
jgi:hypothetical protein